MPYGAYSVFEQVLCYYCNDYNKAVDRRELWDDLRRMRGQFGAEAWILMGDFNSFRLSNERFDMECIDSTDVSKFNACIEDMEIDDLTAKGFFYLV